MGNKQGHMLPEGDPHSPQFRGEDFGTNSPAPSSPSNFSNGRVIPVSLASTALPTVSRSPNSSLQPSSGIDKKSFSGATTWNLKVVLRGAPASGKSTLLSILGGGSFSENYTPSSSLQSQFVDWNHKSSDDHVVIEAWDGAESKKDVSSAELYNKANGVIFLVDPFSPKSISHVKALLNEVLSHSSQSPHDVMDILILISFRDMAASEENMRQYRSTFDVFHDIADKIESSVDGYRGMVVGGAVSRVAECSLQDGFGLRQLQAFVSISFLRSKQRLFEEMARKATKDADQACDDLTLLTKEQYRGYRELYLEAERERLEEARNKTIQQHKAQVNPTVMKKDSAIAGPTKSSTATASVIIPASAMTITSAKPGLTASTKVEMEDENDLDSFMPTMENAGFFDDAKGQDLADDDFTDAFSKKTKKTKKDKLKEAKEVKSVKPTSPSFFDDEEEEEDEMKDFRESPQEKKKSKVKSNTNTKTKNGEKSVKNKKSKAIIEDEDDDEVLIEEASDITKTHVQNLESYGFTEQAEALEMPFDDGTFDEAFGFFNDEEDDTSPVASAPQAPSFGDDDNDETNNKDDDDDVSSLMGLHKRQKQPKSSSKLAKVKKSKSLARAESDDELDILLVPDRLVESTRTEPLMVENEPQSTYSKKESERDDDSLESNLELDLFDVKSNSLLANSFPDDDDGYDLEASMNVEQTISTTKAGETENVQSGGDEKKAKTVKMASLEDSVDLLAQLEGFADDSFHDDAFSENAPASSSFFVEDKEDEDFLTSSLKKPESTKPKLNARGDKSEKDKKDKKKKKKPVAEEDDEAELDADILSSGIPIEFQRVAVNTTSSFFDANKNEKVSDLDQAQHSPSQPHPQSQSPPSTATLKNISPKSVDTEDEELDFPVTTKTKSIKTKVTKTTTKPKTKKFSLHHDSDSDDDLVGRNANELGGFYD